MVHADGKAVEFVRIGIRISVEDIFGNVLRESFGKRRIFRPTRTFFVRCQSDRAYVYLAHPFHDAACIYDLAGRRFAWFNASVNATQLRMRIRRP